MYESVSLIIFKLSNDYLAIESNIYEAYHFIDSIYSFSFIGCLFFPKEDEHKTSHIIPL